LKFINKQPLLIISTAVEFYTQITQNPKS